MILITRDHAMLNEAYHFIIRTLPHETQQRLKSVTLIEVKSIQEINLMFSLFYGFRNHPNHLVSKPIIMLVNSSILDTYRGLQPFSITPCMSVRKLQNFLEEFSCHLYEAWLIATVLDLALPVKWLTLQELKIVHAMTRSDSLMKIHDELTVDNKSIQKICQKVAVDSELSLKKIATECLTDTLFTGALYDFILERPFFK